MTSHATLFVRPTQVPADYGISRATLYRWAAKGIVKIYKRGNCSFVRRDEMDAAIMGEAEAQQ